MEASLPGGNPSAALPPQVHPVEFCLDNLKDEVLNVLRNETSYKDNIQNLETELAVYKRAFADLNAELQTAQLARLETEEINTRLQAECLAFKKQDKGHRVVILLDGDGAIFSPHLIGQGQKGGHAAAQLLSDSTMHCLTTNHGPRTLQLWVYVFFNKRGLIETFRRAGFIPLISKFEDFVMGFNQATERFLMVDVGNTKEAADAKLKVYLEDEIRLPETFKIVFGGCHDNGYVANLHSQITAGYKEKLILLKSYEEMATGIAMLGLPTLTIPDLFMSQKISDDAVFSPTSSRASKDLPSVMGSPLSGNVGLGPGNAAPSTPRVLNLKIPIAKQKPGLCTLYYLKGSCTFTTSCKYAHDYILTEAQREELVKFAKKAPCPTALKGGKCGWEDSCPYGHVCPYSPNCFFNKQGKCKFKQANMHATPATTSG
ncbi:hypothetical protein DFH07DRAFT_794069 [Mycena maculata]|uniref:C3H1-type domain-containing protein n=1 Tax=Mycena maculata TaxID=230809 RepID=A0AAD7K7X1_9AGAR|nr:hypothetical protein DFH07DRAFT_794069 [Mycena maculata]